MKKINQILVVLIVLMSTISFASATTTTSPDDIYVNVIDDTTTAVVVTHIYNGPYPDTAAFEIKDGATDTATTELVGTWDNSDWTQTGPEAPHTMGIDPVTGFNMSTWNFYIKDGNVDDTGQVGKEYMIYFTVDGVTTGGSIIIGSSTTVAHAVPEFPTIALPIAAILGLAFIFQRRREEE